MAEDMPKIHVDSDWKAEAQAEKDRLSEQVEEKSPADSGGIPTPSFETLVSTMATQAMFAMGLIPDPRSGQRVQHLELARHHIDMLSVLEKKTKGNLSEDEEKLITTTVYELRNNYIAIGSAARSR